MSAPPHYLNGYAREEWQRIAPELHRLNLLSILDVSALAVYSNAAAQLRQAEEAIESMAKQEPSGRALTIKGSAGNQVINPLLRIARQASNDMLRYGAAFGLTPNGRLRLSGIKPPSTPSKFDGLLGS